MIRSKTGQAPFQTGSGNGHEIPTNAPCTDIYNLRTTAFNLAMSKTPKSPSPEPPGPLPIRRLQESLINRIAAGEVRARSLM